MRRRASWIRAVIVPWMFASWAEAGELCFDYADRYPCPPGDIVASMNWIGFRTDAAACVSSYGEYGLVTISRSSTDPYDNTGALPEDGRLYLWNVEVRMAAAPAGYGWGGIQCTLAGSLGIAAYEPIAAGESVWSSEHRSFFFMTCETDDAPTLVGAFVIETSAVEPSSWGNIKALYR